MTDMQSPAPESSRDTGLRARLAQTPPVVRTILLINLLVFALPFVADLIGVRYKTVMLSDLLLIWGAKDNLAIAAGDQYYRFITMMFLHGGLLHLLFNSMAIVSIGSELERLVGQQRFLGLYFVSGFAGGVASYLFTANPSVGASGAIFGLIGAEIVFILRNRRLFGDDARQLLGNIGFTAVLNIGIGVTVPNIDNMAHLGGLVGGLLVGVMLLPTLVPMQTADGIIVGHRYPQWGWWGVSALVIALVLIVMTMIPAFAG
jgi:rhomboid protease GluP